MISLLEALLNRLTGKKSVVARVPVSLNLRGEQSASYARETSANLANLGQGGADAALRLTNSEIKLSHYESETLSYSARGLINTAAGRSRSVDVKFNMSRELAYSLEQNFQMGEIMTDPLVVNFSGNAASLTSRKYEFDLDLDGSADSISFAGEGSGFLALDKNGDGVINDGSELFGPQSGSGFDELRAYDSDGNSWIDENDDIFSKLRVWFKDEDGNDLLISLKAADVGAIFLGDISTEYSIGGDGRLRSTSVFLKESGGAGTIQHIDLSV